MQNLLVIWSGMTPRRRLIVVGATTVMFLAVLSLSLAAGRPQMALLYAGLEPSAAGDVIAALDASGIQHEVRGDSIYVPAAERDMVRLSLASEGLPASDGDGYELLDGISGFGTTSQMFDAAYWRAKEGELARTIMASPIIKSARVHIAQASSRPFLREGAATASVTVTTSGGTLPRGQAKAIRHLVAAAVSGMRAENVQVIDSVEGLIEGDADIAIGGQSTDERAERIRQNVERILEARVGPGKAVVEVAVEVVTDRESILERRFDPEGRVAISSETEERSGTSTQADADVTVASNLPDGQADGGSADKSENAETRERVNYEVSETKREVLRVPGSIKKLSVAVLVDGQIVIGQDGNSIWQVRSEEELSVLRELVASTVGLDETRGDVLTLKSLQFEPLGALGTTGETSLWPTFGPIDVMSLIQIAVLAFVSLILGLFVVRPLFAQPTRTASFPALPAPSIGLPAPDGTMAARVLNGEIDDGRDIQEMALIPDDASEAKTADAVARLRTLIEARQTESVEILRGWMELEEERR